MYTKKGLKIAFSVGCLFLASAPIVAQAAESGYALEVVSPSDSENARDMASKDSLDNATVVTSEDKNITPTKTISDAELFEKIPASKSKNHRDVCVYVSGSGSKTYRDLVNDERGDWGLSNVAYSKDLEEGAMMRAGEDVVLYMTGLQDDVLSHDSQEYYVGWENLAASQGLAYKDSFAFNQYKAEKKYLPEDFNPKSNNYAGRLGIDSQVIGHYTTMVSSGIKYVGQGVAYSDSNCDGTAEFMVYANEHATSDKDLYPNLSTEIEKNLTENLNVTDTDTDSTSNDTDSTPKKAAVDYSHDWVGSDDK